jgi:hypothetical protein
VAGYHAKRTLENYLLGTLSEEDWDAFEESYFECAREETHPDFVGPGAVRPDDCWPRRLKERSN